MEWESVLGELVAFIKNVAPEVWSSFVKQVYINACGFVIATIVFLCPAVILIRCGKKAKDSGNHKEQENVVPYYVFGVTFLAFALLVAFLAFSRFANPEYFVVRDLLMLISGE